MAIDTDGVPVIEAGGPPPGRRSVRPIWLLLAVLALLVLGGAYAWQRHATSEANARLAVTPPEALPQARPTPPASEPPKPLVMPKNSATRTPASIATTSPPKIPGSTKPKRIASAPPKITEAAALSPVSSPVDRQISQLRKTFEKNGWTVYWLGSKGQVSAWKSEGKTGYEIRISRGAHQATILKTGGRNIVRQRWTVPLAVKPVLQGSHLYTSASALLRGALAHD